MYHDRISVRVPTVGIEFQPKRVLSNSSHITCFSGPFNELFRLPMLSVSNAIDCEQPIDLFSFLYFPR